jgi:hypothetical protein
MRRVSLSCLCWAILIALGLLAVGWWLLVTGGRPWQYRPFGKYVPSQGWARPSPPLNTRAREELTADLKSDDPERRAWAAYSLANPRGYRFDPQWDLVLEALRRDPSEHVRRTALGGLEDALRFGWERIEAARRTQILEALSQATLEDEDPDLRDNAYQLIADLGGYDRRPDRPAAARPLAVPFARERFEAATRSHDPQIAARAKEALDDLRAFPLDGYGSATGRSPASAPGEVTP